MSRNNEAKTEHRSGGNRGRYAALAGGILLAALLLGWGMFAWLSGILKQDLLRNIEQAAAQNQMWVQSATAELENTAADWLDMIRSREYNDLDDILDAASLGNLMLGSRQLFLVDDDFFFCGSNGLIMPMPEYDGYLNGMQSDRTMVLHDAAGSEPALLVCVKCKPFSAADETFLYAVAEFAPGELFVSPVDDATGGARARCILDNNGKTVAQMGEAPVLRLLEGARIDAYPSVDALKDAILAQEHLCVTCTLADSNHVLISDKIGNQDWVLLSLFPLDGSTHFSRALMLVFGILAGLLVAAATGLILLLLRFGVQQERANAAQASCQATQEALERAQETNRSQTAFLKRISHDIRTPLSSIAAVSYTHLTLPTKA